MNYIWVGWPPCKLRPQCFYNELKPTNSIDYYKRQIHHYYVLHRNKYEDKDILLF